MEKPPIRTKSAEISTAPRTRIFSDLQAIISHRFSGYDSHGILPSSHASRESFERQRAKRVNSERTKALNDALDAVLTNSTDLL